MKTEIKRETPLNYMAVKKFSLFRRFYLCFDVPEHLIIRILAENKIPFKIVNLLKSDKIIYDVIFVSIPKRFRVKFYICMEMLANRAVAYGYTSYKSDVALLMKMFDK